LLFASFWLFDQRMYDDDYGRWLVPARELGYGVVMGDLLRPFPPDWGFLHRPALLLWFKSFGDAFGDGAAPYFALKSGVFAVLVGLLTWGGAHLAWETTRSRAASLLAAAATTVLFTTAEPVFASLLWLSDMETAAQCAVLAASALYLRHVLEGRELTVRSGAWVVLIAFVGFKLKATAKMLPLLLGGHALTLSGAPRRRALWIAGVLLALCVPWTLLGTHPLPPIVDFSGGGTTEAFYWQPANATSWSRLLVGAGAASSLRGTATVPTGLLETWAPFGLALSLGGLVIASRAAIRGAPLARFTVLLLGLHLCSLGTAPDIPEVLLGRYLFGLHLPLALLAGLASAALVVRWRGAGAAAAALLLVTQLVLNVGQSSVRKRTQGCQITVADRTSEYLANEIRGSNVVLLDVPDLAYGSPHPSNSLIFLSGAAPDTNAHLQALAGQARPLLLVTAAPIPSGSPWALKERIAQESAYWRLFGDPLGRCERNVHELAGR